MLETLEHEGEGNIKSFESIWMIHIYVQPHTMHKNFTGWYGNNHQASNSTWGTTIRFPPFEFPLTEIFPRKAGYSTDEQFFKTINQKDKNFSWAYKGFQLLSNFHRNFWTRNFRNSEIYMRCQSRNTRNFKNPFQMKAVW